MSVFLPTPQTGTLCLALAAAMVRVPCLTPEALADIAGKATVSWFVMRRFTPVFCKANKNTIPEDPFLSLLIFKPYHNFPDFGLCPFAQKPEKFGHFEIVSLLDLSFEFVIIRLRGYPCNEEWRL